MNPIAAQRVPRRFAYARPPEIGAPGAGARPVVVVGAGPVGLAAAIDLAAHGRPVLVLAASDSLSEGSRAICFAKRTLEILDRLGCAEPMVRKGVVWNLCKVFHRDRQLYAFNLLPETGHRRPAFINLQQYHFEAFLLERLAEFPHAELRWRNAVTGIHPHGDHVRLDVSTPDGDYSMYAHWVIACDGARSPVRKMLGLESKGQVFQDRFLIADVKMQADFPTERWFWFDPPFHPNQSVLLHRQADDVWRIDFQLGWDADPEIERAPERVIPRIRAMLGEARPFTLEWVSVYTFTCRRMDRFRHGRVVFAGDAAHQVSPFGARGANSGIQDTDNLVWKLDLVMQGVAPEWLLDSYDAERVPAADENILASTRSTDFITPKSAVSRVFRDATLELAARFPFARRLVNSGRLSLPTTYRGSPLNTHDRDLWAGGVAAGAPALDAPVARDGRAGWLLDSLGGRFVLLAFGDGEVRAMAEALEDAPAPIDVVAVTASRGIPGALADVEGTVARRYGAEAGACYLFRPDQHVCARWRRFDAAAVLAAQSRALGHGPEPFEPEVA